MQSLQITAEWLLLEARSKQIPAIQIIRACKRRSHQIPANVLSHLCVVVAAGGRR